MQRIFNYTTDAFFLLLLCRTYRVFTLKLLPVSSVKCAHRSPEFAGHLYGCVVLGTPQRQRYAGEL